MEVSTTTVTSTPTTSRDLPTRSATSSTSASDNSFVGNAPSTVLFFLALAVGVFIASLFVFFTIRYFIRAKYGLHIYPVAQRHMFLSSNIATMNHTTSELQEQLNYVRANNFITSDMFDRRLNLGMRRRRRRQRRDRFSKMKKLTETEVETLFPKKTYNDWLNGGKERDHENRDGVLQEEDEFSETNANKVEDYSSNESCATNNEAGPSSARSNDVEMTEINPHVTVEEELHFTSGTCAICLEFIEDDDIVRGLVCGHVFHAECLDPWLTKRRACCPMCKRDYYYKGNQADQANQATGINDSDSHDAVTTNTENNQESNGNTSNDDSPPTNETNEEAGNGEDMREDTDSMDIELFRNDPTLRAMLQELIPINDRVRMILHDESLQHLHLDAVGLETAKRKRSNILKIIFWKIMGITRDDLYNYGVLTAYHKHKLDEERREYEAQQANAHTEEIGQQSQSEHTERTEHTEHTEHTEQADEIENTLNIQQVVPEETDLSQQSHQMTATSPDHATEAENSINQTNSHRPTPSNHSQRSLSVVSMQTAYTHISTDATTAANANVSQESVREANDNRV